MKRICCLSLLALAVASGWANETAVWQARIDAASASGGGRVVVPAGIHPVAELELRDNVTLELAEGARLTAVRDYSLYRWQKGLKAELQRTGVVALAEGKCCKDAIAFAQKASAISVTRPGAQSSVPFRKEVR